MLLNCCCCCFCCLYRQDREGEGSKADSTFSSGLLTPSNAMAPGSPAQPGSPNLLAMLLQTSYQPLVPGEGTCGMHTDRLAS